MPRLSKLSRSIEGKVAIVTGAASGMGRATAGLFADEGAHVAVTDLDIEKIQIVVDEIRASGGSAHGWRLDVTNASERRSVSEAVQTRWDGIDILVNNAGIAIETAVDSDNFEAIWDRTIAVLLTAQVQLIRDCLPALEKSGGGRIVNIASTEGLGATKGISPYTAAKTGVIGLTRSLAVELGPRGITVNCICPGPILTGMTAAIPDEAKKEFARRRVALKRYGDPEEVAHGTLNFVLPASSYMTGAVLPVDGGLTIKNA
ncbi:MAG: SDR family NAD(P)-dependent oxidoreductase [Gammaproteobacteria bacterium]|jgi:3-oxoacyl-[acyl-carrier protein] reductase|nr:SDR family NAD(P)-dependent oxidoreductase [Gammaproteobacteria bacterium]